MVLKINDYYKCSMCGHAFLPEDLFFCDGIIGYKRILPYQEWQEMRCNRLICRTCKKQVGGYDFCDICYKDRGGKDA